MTFEQAKALRYGDRLTHKQHPDLRVRVNGKPKTWTRDKSRILIPVKWGLYRYFYIGRGPGCAYSHKDWRLE